MVGARIVLIDTGPDIRSNEDLKLDLDGVKLPTGIPETLFVLRKLDPLIVLWEKLDPPCSSSLLVVHDPLLDWLSKRFWAMARSRTATSFAVGRSGGLDTRHSAIKLATGSGQSSGDLQQAVPHLTLCDPSSSNRHDNETIAT